jgi:hypothetical protein
VTGRSADLSSTEDCALEGSTTTVKPIEVTTLLPEPSSSGFHLGSMTNRRDTIQVADVSGNYHQCPRPRIKRCVHRDYSRCAQLYTDDCMEEGHSYKECASCLSSGKLNKRIRNKCQQAKADESGDSC